MSEASERKRDFNIAFNQADRAWAIWIAWVLEEAGYSVFFQDWDFRGNFVEHMNRAHAQAHRTLAVLSDSYFGSDFTLAEWSARFAQDPGGREDRLVPVKVGPLRGETILGPIIYADLTECDEAEAQRRLLERVRKAVDANYRDKPTARPSFPQVPGKPLFPTPEVVAASIRQEKASKATKRKSANITLSDEPIKHIFVSYNHEDGDFADLLKERLESRGFKLWTDENKLLPGGDWKVDIDEAIRSSVAVILIMTPASKSSEYVSYEWAFAWGSGVKLIPILLKATKLHPRLESLQYLDFTNRLTRPWDKLFNFLKNLYDDCS